MKNLYLSLIALLLLAVPHTLEAQDECSTVPVLVNVNDGSSAWARADTVCSTTPVSIFADFQSPSIRIDTIVEYEWIVNGSPISLTANRLDTTPTVGTVMTIMLNASLVDTAGIDTVICVSSDTLELTVLQRDTIDVQGLMLEDSICRNGGPVSLPVPLDGSGNPIPGVWTLNGALLATGSENAPLEFDPIGASSEIIFATYTADASLLCLEPGLDTFYVKEVANVGVPIATFPTFCEGVSRTFNLGELLNGEDIGGSWISDGLAVANPIEAGDLPTGRYDYQYVQETMGCRDTSAIVSINILAAPEILTATATDVTTCQSTTGMITVTTDVQNRNYQIVLTGSTGSSTTPIIPGTTTSYTISNLGADTYSLSIFYTDPPFCSSEFPGTLVVAEPDPPAVSIVVSANDVCLDDFVTVRADVSTYDAYQWTISGGSSTNPLTSSDLGQVNWVSAGPKTITLTAMDGGCTSMVQQETVTVASLPEATVSTPDGTILDCRAEAAGGLELVGSESSGVSYDWSGPMTGGAAGAGSTFTATRGGIYQLEVTSNDALACQALSPEIAVIEDLTDPTVTVTSQNGQNTLTCVENSIVLNASATSSGAPNSFTYTWNAGNNPNQSSNTVTTGGAYMVTVVNGRNGCDATGQTITITVDRDFPTLNAVSGLTTSSGVELDCSNAETTLVPDVGGVTGLNYTWTGPGLNVNTTTLLLTQANNEGNYNLDITDPSNQCVTPFAFTVEKDFRAPSFSIEDNSSEEDFSVCDGEQFSFSAELNNDQAGDSPAYAWSLAGTSILGNTSSFNPSSSGLSANSSNSVTLMVTYGSNGCASTNQVGVAVFQNPLVSDLSFTELTGAAVPDNALCVGGTGRLTATVSQGSGGYQYRWERNGVQVPGQTGFNLPIDAVAAAPNDIYDVIVTDGNGCTDTERETVQVFGNPAIAFSSLENSGTTANNFEVCSGDPLTLSAFVTSQNTVSPYSYAWSSGETVNSITPPTSQTGNTNYVVTVTDTRGCASSAAQIINVRLTPSFTLAIDDQNNDILCSGEAFNIVASNTLLDYEWSPDFTGETGNVLSLANGLIGSIPNTEYTRTTIGTTRDFGCPTTESITFDVNANPVVGIQSDEVRFQLGFGGQFTADVQFGESLSHVWTITRPDGSNIVPPNMGPSSTSVKFDQVGTWTITLETIDQNGCTQTTVVTEEVTSGVDCSANFRISLAAGSGYCPGESYAITDQSDDGSTNPERINRVRYEFNNANGLNAVMIDGQPYTTGIYTVDVGAGEADINDLRFVNPGQWTITMTVSNSQDPTGCSDQAVREITVLAAPTLVTFSLVDTEVCEGESATLFAEGNEPADMYRLFYRIVGTTANTSFDFTGSGTTEIFAPDGASFEVIRLENLTSSCVSDITDQTTSTLTVRDLPRISNLTPLCGEENVTYTISFNVRTDGGNAYSVDGVSYPSGQTFVSDPISRDNGYSFDIRDVEGCLLVLSGNQPSCDCETMIGTWPESITVCQNEEIRVTPISGYVSDGNDRIVYQLVGERNGTVETTLFTSSPVEPTVDLGIPAVNNNYDPDLDYFLLIETGNRRGNSIDPADPCAQSTRVAISVLAQPEITFTDPEDMTICSGDVVDINVNVLFPPEAVSIELLYILSNIDENGNESNRTLLDENFTESGVYTILSQQVNRDSRVTLTDIIIRYAGGQECRFDAATDQVLDVLVNQVPRVNSLQVICEDDNENYRVTFRVATEDGVNFDLVGNPTGTITGNRFTSDPLPNEVSYDLVVRDANGCQTIVPVLPSECDTCFTNVGTSVWNNGELSFCESTGIRITETPGDFNADDNDRISYVLTEVLPNGTSMILEETTGEPDMDANFGSINELTTFNRSNNYRIIVYLGNDNGNGPAATGDRCLSIDTIPLVIEMAPDPVIEVLDPATNTYSSADLQTFNQNAQDVQFRIRNGVRENPRYAWNTQQSGADFFDNPYSDPSYLSLNLGATAGTFTLRVVESLDTSGTCFGEDEIDFVVLNQAAGGERLVYLIDNNGINVLVVTGDAGCTYQWGSTAKSGNEDPIFDEGETFQSYTLGAAFDPTRRLYFVDVSCPGFGTSRYYYNRERTVVNEPENMSPVSNSGVGLLKAGYITINPNPNAGKFQLVAAGVAPGEYDIKLFDGLGREVMKSHMIVDEDRQNTRSLILPKSSSAGVYHLRLTNASGAFLTTRVLIHR